MATFVLMKPNFKTDYAVSVMSCPVQRATATARLNVATEAQMKFLHKSLKFQKVEGPDNSYAKRAPPMGAPNATDTPAEIPAATNSLYL